MKLLLVNGHLCDDIQVEMNLSIQQLKQWLANKYRIDPRSFGIQYEGIDLPDDVKIIETGMCEGCVITMVPMQIPLGGFAVGPTGGHPQPSRTNPAAPAPSTGNPFNIKNIIHTIDRKRKQSESQMQLRKEAQYVRQAERLLKNFEQSEGALLADADPEVIEVLMSRDVNKIAQLVRRRHEVKLQKIAEEQARFRQLSKDPMNPQYQRMLMERINQENVNRNYQFAQEYLPEVFGRVNMLYIRASINKQPIQAFVDSGAQSTIMSEALANKCGLMRLVDKRFAGIAKGVGQCKILGRIHAAQLQIEDKFISCSFTVIENNGIDFLFGLDNLKRFNVWMGSRQYDSEYLEE